MFACWLLKTADGDNAAAADGAAICHRGGIHPRSKYHVGRRLAVASHALVYGGSGPTGGPVISGCEVNGDQITVHFNKTLLKGDTIQVKKYNKTAGVSGAGVLGNISFFCAEARLRCKMVPGNATRPERCGSAAQEWYCPAADEGVPADAPHLTASQSEDDAQLNVGLTGVPPTNPYIHEWLVADIAEGSDGASLIIDASGLNGTKAVGVKYAYDMPRACCDTGDPLIGKSVGCALEACPVTTSPSKLVPNPFMVKIIGGTCVCTAPQVC